MRFPKGVPCAACGKGAADVLPHVVQRHFSLRWRLTIGFTSGRSISSYSPITAPASSSANGRPQWQHCVGRCSSTRSGASDKSRACPLCPAMAPPGRDPSRFALRSVDGGFDDVRDVLSGRCRRRTSSTNSGFVSPSSSSRFTDRMNHTPTALARGWVVTFRSLLTRGTCGSPPVFGKPRLVSPGSRKRFGDCVIRKRAGLALKFVTAMALMILVPCRSTVGGYLASLRLLGVHLFRFDIGCVLIPTKSPLVSEMIAPPNSGMMSPPERGLVGNDRCCFV